MKLIFATLLLGLLSCATGSELTLAKAVDLMLEHEPELNAAEYDTLSAIGDHRLALSELRPQFTLDSSSGYSKRNRSSDDLFGSGEDLLQREIGLSLRQLLYDGGVARNNANSTYNAHIAQQLTEKSLIEKRVVDLSEVFLEILRVRQQIQLAQQNVDVHRAMRDMLQERANAGGSRSEVGLVYGRMQLAVNTLATQRLALNLAEARFQRLVGVTPQQLVPPAIPSVPDDLGCIDTSGNFDYLAAKEALEAAEHRYAAAISLKNPKIYFDADYSRGQNNQGIRGEDSRTQGLIVGSWALHTGGRNKAYECREHFQVGKFEELVRAADLQRQYNLKVLWQERQGSKASMEALHIYARELVQVTSDYDEQFKIGQQSLLNILDIKQEYYSANSRYLDAKFDTDQSAFRIMGVQGKLSKYLIGSTHLDNFCKAPVCDSQCHPDNRVPATQPCLMAQKYDGDGPVIHITPTLREAYYGKLQAIPVECDEKGRCGSCLVAQRVDFEIESETKKQPFKKFGRWLKDQNQSRD